MKYPSEKQHTANKKIQLQSNQNTLMLKTTIHNSKDIQFQHTMKEVGFP
jgi:hypothetical protein